MGRARRLIVVIGLALFVPAAAAAAESPPLYVGSGPDWSIAFKAEGDKVSVIGLDAPVYCEIGRKKAPPAVWKFFATPAPMGRDGDRLTGSEGTGTPKSEWQMRVDATLAGGRIVGSFEYLQTGEPGWCQTVDYVGSGDQPQVPFEALRYEPAAGATPVPPFGSVERAVYYGTEGSLESFFTVAGSRLDLRGSVGSSCLRATAKHGPGRRPLEPNLLIPLKAPSPFITGILEAPLSAGASFREALRTNPAKEYPVAGEALRIAGSVGDEAVTGTYFRRFHTFFPRPGKRVCQTGPLPFRARRYLPVAP